MPTKKPSKPPLDVSLSMWPLRTSPTSKNRTEDHDEAFLRNTNPPLRYNGKFLLFQNPAPYTKLLDQNVTQLDFFFFFLGMSL